MRMKHLLMLLVIGILLPTPTVSQAAKKPFRIIQMPIQLRRNELRDTTLNYIVIHNDGANMSASQTRNVLRRRRLAYHYFIDRQGKVYEYVNPRLRAPHAGVTFAEGMWKWNDFSIGICLQGMNGLIYTDLQYEGLQSLITHLDSQYTLQPKIYTHSEIAFPWGRKDDPGSTFDVNKITIDTI
jgi:N-acetyl-anhydromuramyl-L-alanine amidase AmpD